MKKVQIMNAEMDTLIKHVLGSNKGMMIPEHLADLTVRKLEKRVLLRELIHEFVFKGLLVIGSMSILAGVLGWAGRFDIMNRILSLVLAYKQLVLVILTASLTILILDQVIIRFYTIQHPNTHNTKVKTS